MGWDRVSGNNQGEASEFIGPNGPRFGHVKRRLYTGLACKGKMAPILEPYNLACPRFFLKSQLSRIGPPGVTWVGLMDIW